MKLTSSFAALSAAVVVALCIGQAHAETVNAPLGLSQVNDEGVPITPLTYLNLEPVEQGALGRRQEGDYASASSQAPQASAQPGGRAQAVRRPAQQPGPLGARRARTQPHPLVAHPGQPRQRGRPPHRRGRAQEASRRSARDVKPLDLGLKTGNAQDADAAKSLLGGLLPIKRLLSNDNPLAPSAPASEADDGSSGLSVLGNNVPLNKLAVPGMRRQADVKPLDLGLKTGNAQDADAAKSLLGGLLPIKRDGDVKPVDLGLKTGNAQDAERANDFLGSLLGGKRDTITPDNLNLDSVKPIVNQGAATVMPIVLNQVKSKASPAVQGIKAANGLHGALGDKDMFEHGLLGGNGEINGIPVRRADPLTDTVLGASDEARDAILGVKDQADNAAGAFVKNMYSKHGEVQTKRDLTLPGYALLPGTGPMAKEGAQELIDFLDLPCPVLRGWTSSGARSRLLVARLSC
ncbi:hypothetical protein L1887_52062 [Cichorium endivia]|nr:hypothetical protein L1887_52062 [Cichorium endivia]